MATSLTLENDSSLAQGYIKVNGSTAATLTTSGITGNLTGNVTGSLTAGGSLTLATSQIASGTSVDFTGIPSWVKRITVMFNGVSTNGTSPVQIQLGDSGGIETTLYASAIALITGTNACQLNIHYSGIVVAGENVSSNRIGTIVISNISSNLWIASGSLVDTLDNATGIINGNKTLTSILDRIRVTTVNGTDTFDAGIINISYEG
jgi:hypothetical protein